MVEPLNDFEALSIARLGASMRRVEEVTPPTHEIVEQYMRHLSAALDAHLRRRDLPYTIREATPEIDIWNVEQYNVTSYRPHVIPLEHVPAQPERLEERFYNNSIHELMTRGYFRQDMQPIPLACNGISVLISITLLENTQDLEDQITVDVECLSDSGVLRETSDMPFAQLCKDVRGELLKCVETITHCYIASKFGYTPSASN